jgi:peptide/nickel transport system permease protein
MRGAGGVRRASIVRRAGAALKRVTGAFATVWVVVSIVFFVMRALPGDPATLVLGEHAGAAERDALRRQWGLDGSLFAQYVQFLGRIAHGHLGPSLRDKTVDAVAIVARALPSTVALATIGVALGALVGVTLGSISIALRGRAVGSIARAAILVASAAPLLAVAPLATWLFAVRFALTPLPADPQAGLAGLFFSGTLLAIPLSAAVARVTAGALGEATRAQFLVTARGKGRGPVGVWALHALPACAGPIVTVVAAQLGALLGGAVVLERMLERDGLGTVLAQALASRDLPVIEAAVVASSALFVIAQGLGTWVHAAIDPRARDR